MSATRRTFLGRLAATATALAAAPGRLLGLDSPRGNGAAATESADSVVAGRRRGARWIAYDGIPTPPPGPLPQEFWEELRGEFLIPRDEAFFNTGTLGSNPRVVVDAVAGHMRHVARDIAHWEYRAGTEEFFTGYAPERELRGKVASLINAETDEVALTQNATFGMNFMANGLELDPGDEVLIMQGAHPGGRGGFELRDARYGPSVRFVPVPATPESPEQLISLYERATNPRTRVWMIPHLTSGTAVLFPVKEMCRRARERGIVSVIDGAQTFGHLRIDVRDMGCDAYFSSPHKWMLSPAGTGILYVRRGLAERLWPTLASSNWDNQSDHGFRIMQYGTGNLSLLIGLDRALDFHAAIGSDRVQARIVGLADRLRAGLAAIPRVTIHSPTHPALRSATTIWSVDGMTGGQIQDELWSRAKVRIRAVGPGARQCCHVYTLEADVDRSLDTVRDMLA